MVLAMRQVREGTIDPKRVAAISGVFLIHLMVLAALLLPRQPVEFWRPAPVEYDMLIAPDEPPPPKPPEPIVIPPPPPQLVPVTPMPPTEPTLSPVPVAPTASNDIVVDTPSDIPVVANVNVDVEASGPALGTAGNLVTLRKRSGLPPSFPRRELIGGIEGDVLLRVLVDELGAPQTIEVIGGTHNRNFELAAIRALKRWRFHPHTVDGVPRSAWASVPVTFRIHN
jgi:protein TonB